jgi:hypothetical protein
MAFIKDAALTISIRTCIRLQDGRGMYKIQSSPQPDESRGFENGNQRAALRYNAKMGASQTDKLKSTSGTECVH